MTSFVGSDDLFLILDLLFETVNPIGQSLVLYDILRLVLFLIVSTLKVVSVKFLPDSVILILERHFLLNENLHIVLETFGLSKLFQKFFNLFLLEFDRLVSGKNLNFDFL